MSSVPIGPTTGTYDILRVFGATIRAIVQASNAKSNITALLEIRFRDVPIVIEVKIVGLYITNDKIEFSGIATRNRRTVYGHFLPNGKSGSLTVE